MIYPTINLEEKLRHMREHAKPKDWYNNISDDELLKYIEEYHTRSHMFKGQCKAFKLPFCDTSLDFLAAVDETIEFLWSGNFVNMNHVVSHRRSTESRKEYSS